MRLRRAHLTRGLPLATWELLPSFRSLWARARAKQSVPAMPAGYILRNYVCRIPLFYNISPCCRRANPPEQAASFPPPPKELRLVCTAGHLGSYQESDVVNKALIRRRPRGTWFFT